MPATSTGPLTRCRPGWLDNLVSVLNGVAIGFLLFILAVGLSLVFGMMDVLNLAHGALFLGGAYLGAAFAGDGQASWGLPRRAGRAGGRGWSPGACWSLMTEPLRRRGHLDQALLTLGVALVVGELLIIVFGDDSGRCPPPRARTARRPSLGGVYPTYRLVLIGVGAVLALVVYLRGRPDAGRRAGAGHGGRPGDGAALGRRHRPVKAAVFAVGVGAGDHGGRARRRRSTAPGRGSTRRC